MDFILDFKMFLFKSSKKMRYFQNPQSQFFEKSVEDVTFDPRSRDDIPKVLIGLQHIYKDKPLRTKLHELLEKLIPTEVDKTTGRPGMHLWRIFVLGVLRLTLNCDYDRLQELANNHRTLREMLGHGMLDSEYYYPMQTLKDNVSHLTPEVLDEINQLIVKSGYSLVKKKDEKLSGSCDSFVVKSNVHYPTDLNLLWDSLRKLCKETHKISEELNLPGWRQYQHLLKNVKSLFNKSRKLNRSTKSKAKKQTSPCTNTANKDLKKEEKKQKIQQEKEEAKNAVTKEYIDLAYQLIGRAQATLAQMPKKFTYDPEDEKENYDDPKEFFFKQSIIKKVNLITKYCDYGLKFVDQIERRVFNGNTIPHSEKVFSIFEEYTEWINKGKAGVPVELGLRVCIMKDQYGFILHHQVLQSEVDSDVTIQMVTETKKRFSELTVCSFDKGFYSKENKIALNEELEKVIMPKKGKRNKAETKEESDPEFITLRYKHSAVESAINGLETGGLDRCPDKGIQHFKNYCALAIVARNLHTLGTFLIQKNLKALQQQERKKVA